ncbi:cardiolipin synthetase [Sphingomonas sp. Leaf412]|uniref:phospholipase D-like domain-containing protein n=1 Tax=Sphingomonas sp. Leaf412 TaxID=1736370 RepID=UPI0006FE22A4|nr:phosphatidylserine/phosphatidylglycerophosphate/cardiolipin synthase family protein [Sphingomonas sp. Leaf412]KQT34976.1 cardiolipin synthetase [Sphingomonas sp. Leaf412]
MDEPADQPAFTVDGNRLTLLDTGPRRLDAVIALIDGARATLRMIFYIYADDHAGRRVNAALIAAAGRGVRVALIVDGFGSDGADAAFFRPLESAGISVCRFSPRFGRRYLLRNHQKLALADADTPDARIIVGGFNIEDDYFGTPAQQAWRDLGLLVEGSAASRMAGYFDALEAGIHDGGRIRRLNKALAKWSERHGRLRWAIGGPTRRLSPWAKAIKRDMRHARRIDLIAAYFMPSPMLLRRIERAGRGRGRHERAAVRVVTAAKSDNNATIAAARFTYAGLLRRGIRLFEYQPTKLHTKLYVVDDATWIGSANFDMRSLFVNLELMLRIEDRAFADHVRGYIDAEIAQSTEVTREGYREATGWWQRGKQFAAYLMMAVADPMVSRGLNWGIDE